uniref:CCHC-type domain-containing protein n=1 Tax=Sander lucioperca TaxID=283035 RepID=A0A8C9ZTV3_SANLU
NGGGGVRKCATKQDKVAEKQYLKRLTVKIQLMGQKPVTPLEVMRTIRLLCGGIMACRRTGAQAYEVTLSTDTGKQNILNGFEIDSVPVEVTELCREEVMVSFLQLPVYIPDAEIAAKLEQWGVTLVSPIRRRMWPGTNVADGTRLVRVRFDGPVKSLPYSTKFETATGPQYFRVIHNYQKRVCRLCREEDHEMKDCPKFKCFRCNQQGHYAKSCQAAVKECICLESEDEEESQGHVSEKEGEGTREFSRRQVVKGVLKQSRIDLCLISHDLVKNIRSPTYTQNLWSDHSTFSCFLGEGVKRYGGLWCFNASLVQDMVFVEKMKTFLTNVKHELFLINDINGWWDDLKQRIKKKCIYYCKDKRWRENLFEKQLMVALNDECRFLDSNN